MRPAMIRSALRLLGTAPVYCLSIFAAVGQSTGSVVAAEDDAETAMLVQWLVNVRIGLRDDADVRASEHRVEVRGELVVSVVDEEPDLAGAVAEAHQEAAGLLGDPVGFAGPDAGRGGRYPGM
jgi:hypothetical protein